MRGKIEASTTRRFVVPCTRKSLPTTARGSSTGPIAQVHEAWWPHAWSRTKERSASGVRTSAPGTSSHSTRSPSRCMIARASSMPATTASRSAPVGVAALLEVAEADVGGVARIGRAQQHAAGAVGGVRLEHRPGEHVGVLGQLARVAGVVAGEARRQPEDEQVGALQLRPGPADDAQQRAVGRVDARALAPLHEGAGRAAPPPRAAGR